MLLSTTDPSGGRAKQSPGWMVILFFGLVLWFCVPTVISLVPAWNGTDYSHGYLVVVLSVILLIRELRLRSVSSGDFSWAGLLLLVPLACVSIVARAATVELIAQAVLPLILLAAVWTYFGVAYVRWLAVPIAFLYFAVPIWNVLVEPLQGLTIEIVSTFIQALDVPAYIDGNLIHTPSGTFEVQEGCAGLRYMIVALALASFVGIVNFDSWIARTELVVAAMALALVGNWARVSTIVLAGYYSDMQSPLLSEHLRLGWVFFVIFMAPLFFVNRLVEAQVDRRRSDEVA